MQEAYPCSDANGTTFWQTVIQREDPDLFVFTGDNVCSGDAAGGADAIDGLLAGFVASGFPIPWIAVEGNHDGESGLDYLQIAEYLLTKPNGAWHPRLTLPSSTPTSAPHSLRCTPSPFSQA